MWSTNNQNLTYRLNNGVPNQLTESISPWINHSRAGWHALFAQEQWTFRRLTLQGALRFDRASSWFPEQQAGPSRFLPIAITFPETEGRRQLQGHHAADGRGLRRVRERQDRAQVQRRANISRASACSSITSTRIPSCGCPARRVVRDRGRDADLDRREREFPARLRSAEPARQRSPRQRRRLLRADLESELRSEDPDQQLRPGAPHRMGRPRLGLEPRRSPCSSSCCRGCPSRSPISGGGSTGSR